MKKKTKTKFIILLLAAALIFYLCLWIYYGNKLTISCYSLPVPSAVEPVRIVLLSDLHNVEYGRGNIQLIETIQSQSPDLIFLTGDLITRSSPETSVAVSLIASLSKIAPTYVSLGNHEEAHQIQYGTDVKTLYGSAGGIVLELEYVDVTVRNTPLRIGGVQGYCLPEKHLITGEAQQDEVDFLKEFQNTDRYTLLLCHNPIAWLVNDSLDEWAVDCVFSGHTHGGQIEIPGVGGVYAPDLGLFPGRLNGLFYGKDSSGVLVLTRGAGSAIAVPRINNPPEIVVIDLIPSEE